MALLAIKGHSTRGSEVIALLGMLGFINKHNYSADCDSLCFYGDKSTNVIYYDWVNNCYEDTLVFTLEEFLEKFPYKVDDKVIYKSEVFPIIGMKWDCCRDIVIYTMKNIYGIVDCFDNTWMKNYKEETMEEKIESFEILESHCSDEVKIEFDPSKFEMVKRDNGYYVVKKQPKYPKTYEECCEVLSLGEDGRLYTKGYKASLIQNFEKLLICRDAYWKISGEQMELSKPWEPDWENPDHDSYPTITRCGGKIIKTTIYTHDCPFAFPTEEMRDAFYENFKDLIEECKELL